MTGFEQFLAACRALGHGDIGAALPTLGLPASLLVLGLVGGVSHCAVMCGPFVLAQTGRRLSAQPLTVAPQNRVSWQLQRIAGMALIPYHAGRAAVYTALGGVAAAAVGGLGPTLGQGQLPGYALLVAALVFLGQAAAPWLPPARGWLTGMTTGGKLGRALTGLLSPLFARPTALGGFLIGVGLGFLPCGLVYTALIAAGASGSLFSGMLAMASFALGTMPALIAVAWLGNQAGTRLRAALSWWLPPVLLLNAAAAAAMGLRWLGLL